MDILYGDDGEAVDLSSDFPMPGERLFVLTLGETGEGARMESILSRWRNEGFEGPFK